MKKLLDQIAQLKIFVNNLDNATQNFKPSGDRWNILEIGEHLIKVETGVVGLLFAPGGAKNPNKQYLSDDYFKAVGLDRTTKLPAPKPMIPSGKFEEMDHIISTLAANRQKLYDALQANAFELDVESLPHPRLGPMTKQDWVNFIAIHFERHLDQMQENIQIMNT